MPPDPDPPALSPRLLAALRCPQTGQRLHRASADERRAFGPAAPDGLVREDGEALYPIRDGFPILLVDEAIPRPGGQA